MVGQFPVCVTVAVDLKILAERGYKLYAQKYVSELNINASPDRL